MTITDDFFTQKLRMLLDWTHIKQCYGIFLHHFFPFTLSNCIKTSKSFDLDSTNISSLFSSTLQIVMMERVVGEGRRGLRVLAGNKPPNDSALHNVQCTSTNTLVYVGSGRLLVFCDMESR